MIYDSHTHLNESSLFVQRKEHLDQFAKVGGKGLLNAGASDEYNSNGLRIAKEAKALFPSVTIRASVGFHPGEGPEISTWDFEQKMRDLRALYEANKEYIVAIGECGIDTFFPGTLETLPLQKKLFAMHCELAQELNLPLMVHSRNDFASTLEVLQNYKDLTVYFHCWSYLPQDYLTLKGMFPKLYIGLCGNVTYKSAHNLRDTLAIVQLDQLLLETDAPWLSPQAVHGTINTPANVRYIYRFVADQLKMEESELESQIETNFQKLYMG